MKIVKERTRLIFTEFTEAEKKHLENIVASMDNVFMYIDPDGEKLGLPTGMEDRVKRIFPKAEFIDKSNEYWPYAEIQPVEHDAKPRNQLQVDFINFVGEKVKNKQKLAGILGVGTGKSQPNHTPIPTPNGWTTMGKLKPGDQIYGPDGNPTKVLQIFPQGILEIFEITLDDGRSTFCSKNHLWKVYSNDFDSPGDVIMTQNLFTLHRYHDVYIPAFDDDSMTNITRHKIIDISYAGKEECTCILVDNKEHLYVTENYIITHNTFMACYSAIAAGLRTLIIAPTSSIKKQWADTLTGMFKVDPSRVLLVNDPKQFINVKADFVIISQASLAILNKSYDLEKIMKDNNFGIKVIDEVQMWFKNIINVDANCNIANNWYLTGTFGRSGDKENKLFQEMFGDLAIFVEKEKKPTIFNQKPGNIYGMKPHVNTKMIWSSSGLSDEEIKKVTSSMRYSEREGKWMRMGINVPAYTNLIIPEDGTITPFMKVIFNTIKMANREVKYGSMLILCSTIASSEIIADHCRKMFPDKKVGVINSEYKMQENENTKKTCDIVVSTVASAGTGFDMKGLAKLILVQPMKSWVLTTQVVGRLRRRDDGRETYFYDIVDSDIRQLRAWANARADVERRMSKTFKVVDM